MDRRSSLKTLILVSAGAAFFTSCSENETGSSLSLKNIKISNKEENLLSKISETLMPATNTPGAKDIAAHVFALLMIDDCYTAEMQDKFKKGLNGFEDLTKKQYGKPFMECSSPERTNLLRSIENKKEIPQNIGFFYSSMKKLTIQAFISSEYYLSKVQVYKIAPGKFYGCVPVKKAIKIYGR